MTNLVWWQDEDTPAQVQVPPAGVAGVGPVHFESLSPQRRTMPRVCPPSTPSASGPTPFMPPLIATPGRASAMNPSGGGSASGGSPGGAAVGSPGGAAGSALTSGVSAGSASAGAASTGQQSIAVAGLRSQGAVVTSPGGVVPSPGSSSGARPGGMAPASISRDGRYLTAGPTNPIAAGNSSMSPGSGGVSSVDVRNLPWGRGSRFKLGVGLGVGAVGVGLGAGLAGVAYAANDPTGSSGPIDRGESKEHPSRPLGDIGEPIGSGSMIPDAVHPDRFGGSQQSGVSAPSSSPTITPALPSLVKPGSANDWDVDLGKGSSQSGTNRGPGSSGGGGVREFSYSMDDMAANRNKWAEWSQRLLQVSQKTAGIVSTGGFSGALVDAARNQLDVVSRWAGKGAEQMTVMSDTVGRAMRDYRAIEDDAERLASPTGFEPVLPP